MKRCYAIILVFLAVTVAAGTAHAQNTSGCPDTPDIHLSIQQAILACDAYINDKFLGRTLPEQRASGYHHRGLLHHLLGKYDLAIADYTSAIGWDRSFGDAYEARGDAYADSGQSEKASADYAKAARLSSDSAGRLRQRCWVRAVRGHPLFRALTDCNEALKEHPGERDMLDTRCFLYFRMRIYSAAVADCDAVERMQKRDASALYIGGLAKRHLGDISAGDADISAALNADHRIADRYALYGVTH